MSSHTRFLSALGALGALVVPLLLADPGHAGSPRCFGEKATIVADSGYVAGTPGADVIVVSGNAEVHGMGGDDRICGSDLVYGGPGNDRIHYGGLSEYDLELHGGRGDDRIFLTSKVFGDINGGPGADRLASRAGEQWINGGPGDDLITGGAGEDRLSGGRGDDVVRGNAGHDKVYGYAGDDRVYGGTGHDVLQGNGGRDAGFGGPGRDTCDDSIERAVNCGR